MRPAQIAPLTALVVALSGCAAAVSAPTEKDLPVDTPEMVALKQAAALEECPAGTTVNGGLPAVELPCLGGGRSVDLSTLRGPLVVNIWGVGCEPCAEEMPVLGDFHRRYGDQVPLLGIDLLDSFPGVALQEARERRATYAQLFDYNGRIQETALRVPGKPGFWFLAADGTVSTSVGGVTSLADFVDLVSEQTKVKLS